jgi:hypothetical protein
MLAQIFLPVEMPGGTWQRHIPPGISTQNLYEWFLITTYFYGSVWERRHVNSVHYICKNLLSRPCMWLW